MNEFPANPREELEAQITALLLGELSEAEAEAIRKQIHADPELQAIYLELSSTIPLVKEALRAPESKLSGERRERLLQSFKLIQAEELAPMERRGIRPIFAIAAMLAFLIVATGLFLPSLAKSKSKSRSLALHREAETAATALRPARVELKDAPMDHLAAADAEGIAAGLGGGAGDVSARFAQNAPEAAETKLGVPFQRGSEAALGRRPITPPASMPSQPSGPGSVEVETVRSASGDVRGFGARLEDESRQLAELKAKKPAEVRQQLAEQDLFLKDQLSDLAKVEEQIISKDAKEADAFFLKRETLERKISERVEASVAGREIQIDALKAAAADELFRVPAEKTAARREDLQPIGEARALIVKGDLEKAKKLLKQVVTNAPDNRAAHYYLGLIEEQRLAQSAQAGVKLSYGFQTPKIPVSQPEVATAENAFSTFSLNVSDVSFKLAAASLDKGLMPDAASIRSEEFINAFDYRDPEPKSAPVAFGWERARYPFAQNRDILRMSVKTAASGRQPGRPLNLVLLLDNSGSMERADRVRILEECLKSLATQLQPEDRISVVAFARTARLALDGLAGSQASELAKLVGSLAPEGGTNLEEAMNVAYRTARKHFIAHGINRVVLLTDGAANLGEVQPETLKKKVEAERQRGVALDCFGIGWEGLNDELLETLSRNGDGRYGFVNTPEAAATEFTGQLAGALQIAASDVKVQIEFNPRRVSVYRQVGYAKHQLTKEQFRDNTVDAAEIGTAEAGNAIYIVQVDPRGEGPLGTARARFKIPGTNDYREHEWPLTYEGAAKALEQSTPALRLAATASAYSEWLAQSPFATEITSDKLLRLISGVPANFPRDPRPQQLESMIRQARSISGK